MSFIEAVGSRDVALKGRDAIAKNGNNLSFVVFKVWMHFAALRTNTVFIGVFTTRNKNIDTGGGAI